MTSKYLILNRSIVATLAGYSIEKYDMFLYGFFTIIIGELFLPNCYSTYTSMIFNLGVFAAGYLMRPFGGIFFGHLGDKLGRKKALLISIGLASIPPFLLTILPTYKQIGIVASVVLLICRLFQGFCSGGEFSGASVFLQEQTALNKVAFSVSLLRAVGFLGVAMGAMIAYLFTLPFMPAWSWRLPFLIGACITITLYFVRLKNLKESPDFQAAEKKGKIVTFPFVDILKHSKTRLSCAMAITVYASTAFYMSTVYISSLLKTEFNLPNHQIMAINAGISLLWVFSIPLLGMWADKLGIKNFISKAVWWNILLVYPLFWLLDKYFSLTNFILFQIVFGLLCASFYAPFAGLLPKIFRVEERYSGVAISITCIQAILGGLTPLITTLLVSYTGDKRAPASLIVISAFVALIGINKLKKFKLEDEPLILEEIPLEKKAATII